MQGLSELKLTGTTAADGSLTVKGTTAIFGWLYAVEWIDGSFADGVDAVVSCLNTASGVNNTLLTLTNANDDDWYFPREAEHTNAGAAAGGYCMPLLNGLPQLAVTSGGDTKTGGCVLYFFR